ncbi:hypothetical protein JXA12_02505 [Candidatus Woesearchaeota archaeon]|nr:hypothetical protein [Candidatus Woesearchaeota archaeon]
MTRSKKAEEVGSISLIGKVILVFVLVGLLLFFSRDLIAGVKIQTEGVLLKTEDYDGDGKMDFHDGNPCVSEDIFQDLSLVDEATKTTWLIYERMDLTRPDAKPNGCRDLLVKNAEDYQDKASAPRIKGEDMKVKKDILTNNQEMCVFTKEQCGDLIAAWYVSTGKVSE